MYTLYVQDNYDILGTIDAGQSPYTLCIHVWGHI